MQEEHIPVPVAQTERHGAGVRVNLVLLEMEPTLGFNPLLSELVDLRTLREFPQGPVTHVRCQTGEARYVGARTIRDSSATGHLQTETLQPA